MRTARASSDGDGWVLNGAKMWITNGTLARRRGRLGEDRRLEDERSAASSCETDTPGFTAPRPEGQARRCAPRSPASSCFEDVPRARRTPSCPKRGGLKSPLVLPDAGALRHRLGRASARRWRATTSALDYAKSRVHVRQARSPATSSCRRSSPTCSPRSPRAQLLALQLGRLKDAGHAHAAAGVAWPSATTSDMALRDRARARATSSARNGIAGEYPVDAPHARTSSRSTPTRGRTTCTR
ncbi:MAG: hypothetical protein MZV64_32265 [Ignavibacteriales bacterium]|nr:hypothetical protein [Ignavibacteriales bacterium]